MNRRVHIAVSTLAVLVLTAGCGDWEGWPYDDEEAATDENPHQDSQTDEDPDVDCPDNQAYHPLEEECFEPSGVGDDGDDEEHDEYGDHDPPSPDCDPYTEHYDENEDQCVPDCRPGRLVVGPCWEGPWEVSVVRPGAKARLVGQRCQQEGIFTREAFADHTGVIEFDDVPPGKHLLRAVDEAYDYLEEIPVLPGQTVSLGVGSPYSAGGGCRYPSTSIVAGDGDLSELFDDIVGLDVYGPDPDEAAYDFEQIDFTDDPDLDALFVEPGAPWNSLDDSLELDELADELTSWIDDEDGMMVVSGCSVPYLNAIDADLLEFDQPESTRSLQISEPVDAHLVDDQLAQRLGSPALTIPPGTTNWAIPSGVDPQARVLLEGDIETADAVFENVPLMVEYDVNDGGRQIFTSFGFSALDPDDASTLLAYTLRGVTAD